MYSGMEEGKYPDRRRRFNKEPYLQYSFNYTVKYCEFSWVIFF